MNLNLHLVFTALAGAALLALVIGAAVGFWRISPSVSGRSQMLIRFGMAVAGVSCVATVLSSWLTGAGWRDRVHWEIAADAGFAVLALGLLLGAVERDVMRRRATRDQLRQSHSEG